MMMPKIGKSRAFKKARAKARRRAQIAEDKADGIHYNPRREDKKRGLDGTMDGPYRTRGT